MNTSVDYAGYQDRTATATRPAWRRLLGRGWRFLKFDLLYNTLLYPYGAWRHGRLLRTSPRSQSHTYTCFMRAPLQLQAVLGPVLDHLAGPSGAPASLKVLMFACSNGAEAYTLASELRRTHPGLALTIDASDLHPEMIEKAIAGRYSREEVLHSPYITPEFIGRTFDREGDAYVVKPALRDCVRFSVSDLLDPELPHRHERADLVIAQNVLFHLPADLARRAFESLVKLMKPRSALMIEGTDLALKTDLTRAHALQPLAWRHREIYAQSRAHVPAAWWRHYYGSEPYGFWRSDRVRRYSSIFTRS